MYNLTQENMSLRYKGMSIQKKELLGVKSLRNSGIWALVG